MSYVEARVLGAVAVALVIVLIKLAGDLTGVPVQ